MIAGYAMGDADFTRAGGGGTALDFNGNEMSATVDISGAMLSAAETGNRTLATIRKLRRAATPARAMASHSATCSRN